MIYMIEAPALGLCKVGYAVKPEARLAAGQAFIPSPVKLAAVRDGSRKLEKVVHRLCYHLRAHGEWFHRPDEVRQHFFAAQEPPSERWRSTAPATICTKIIRDAGGPAKLAACLNEAGGKPITPQAVSQWRRVPAERVIAIEAICGVSRHEVRPDIFGPAPKETAA